MASDATQTRPVPPKVDRPEQVTQATFQHLSPAEFSAMKTEQLTQLLRWHANLAAADCEVVR